MSQRTTFTSQGLLRELQASTEHSRTTDSEQCGKAARHEIWKLSDRGPLHDTIRHSCYSQFRPTGFDE